MRRKTLISLVLVLVLASLSFATAAADDPAMVYVGHGIPGQALGLDDNELPVDVLVNDTCLLKGFEFGDFAGPEELAAGTYDIEIREADIEHPCEGTLVIEAEGVPEDDPVWGEVSKVIRSDGYFESWKYVIEGNEVKVIPDVMDAVSSRKGRDTAINEGDITDLKISLGNAQTVDDILKAMGGA